MTTSMSKFEQVFRLWLAGYGVTQEQCDKLCAHPGLAIALRMQDATGLTMDLPGCLAGIEKAQELQKALASPKEQLLLICALS
jgi:hypothetical protein